VRTFSQDFKLLILGCGLSAIVNLPSLIINEEWTSPNKPTEIYCIKAEYVHGVNTKFYFMFVNILFFIILPPLAYAIYFKNISKAIRTLPLYKNLSPIRNLFVAQLFIMMSLSIVSWTPKLLIDILLDWPEILPIYLTKNRIYFVAISNLLLNFFAIMNPIFYNVLSKPLKRMTTTHK